MKKLMCVLILVAFLGSMVVMTGCFGGSDGLGILAGVLVIAIAVSATGGSGAVAFAANNRAAERPAIRAAASKRFFARITPYGQTAIDKVEVAVEDGKLKLNQNVNATSANGQYSVEIFSADEDGTASTEPIYKHHFVKTVAAGVTASYPATVAAQARDLADDTAEALVYDKWVAASSESTKPTIDNMDKTSAGPDITALTTNIKSVIDDIATDTSGAMIPDSEFVWGATVTDYALTQDIKRLYSISGFVTKVDQSGGIDGCYVYAGDYNTTTQSGYYTLNVPAGTHNVCPSYPHHTFTPSCTEVTITNANVGSINFQAVAGE